MFYYIFWKYKTTEICSCNILITWVNIYLKCHEFSDGMSSTQKVCKSGQQTQRYHKTVPFCVLHIIKWAWNLWKLAKKASSTSQLHVFLSSHSFFPGVNKVTCLGIEKAYLKRKDILKVRKQRLEWESRTLPSSNLCLYKLCNL